MYYRIDQEPAWDAALVRNLGVAYNSIVVTFPVAEHNRPLTKQQGAEYAAGSIPHHKEDNIAHAYGKSQTCEQIVYFDKWLQKTSA